MNRNGKVDFGTSGGGLQRMRRRRGGFAVERTHSVTGD